ncbi:MAG: 8-amino-7-oxononanoate synthase [Pseudomonadota bacterium]
MLDHFQDKLSNLKTRHRYRCLEAAAGLDFTSNDYLAFSKAPEIRDALVASLADGLPVGAGGSRLLRGNHPAHESLEEQAARFFGAEATLYFASGYIANFAALTTLPQRGDLILFDERMHASVKEGLHAGHAKSQRLPHNDACAAEDAILAWRRRGGKGRPWITVESLYSMDGDVAPLADYMTVATRCDAMLMVDEAHATGVFGAGGKGLTEPFAGRENLIVVHTCGKALGAAGGLICANQGVIDYLVNHCRPFIYSTAPAPMMAQAVSAALTLLEHSPEHQKRLQDLMGFANRHLTEACGQPASGSQILPVIIGLDKTAVHLASSLQAQGYDIRAIRPPTVPEGTARLRIAITLHVTEKDIAEMFQCLAQNLGDLAA